MTVKSLRGQKISVQKILMDGVRETPVPPKFANFFQLSGMEPAQQAAFSGRRWIRFVESSVDRAPPWFRTGLERQEAAFAQTLTVQRSGVIC
jgi:hypothetical protein